ncbi:hypothetical protein ACIHFD_66000 [Nonomuraea sp. NPDC051941]|uniref:hypothetical protein n=1 Tax=Nonomuraea sp. NPDC051941 TaxID=3364373 RepID=UPI0037CB5DB5
MRDLPWYGPLCCGCGDDVHYLTVQDGIVGAFRAALVACHVCTDEKGAACTAAAEAIRCQSEATWLGIDLGPGPTAQAHSRELAGASVVAHREEWRRDQWQRLVCRSAGDATVWMR